MEISEYEINDEETPVDGWDSGHKGRFAEQSISERQYKEKEKNIEEGEQVEAVEKLTEWWGKTKHVPVNSWVRLFVQKLKTPRIRR